jgi:hypothetical protein
MVSCPPFWWESPMILIDHAADFFPFTEMDKRCTASALNSFTRFGIYLGILLAVIRMDAMWLLVGVVFAGFAVGAWMSMEKSGAIREGFAGEVADADTDAPIVDASKMNGRYVPDVIGEAGRTGPTAANPFMNVLISEISDNPYKNPAANVQNISVKNELDSYFETMFASDPGDTFQHTQSQRQWVTMPWTTVPNDRDSYQNWLYRVPGQTCKEGNQEVCNFDTGDAALPWREMRRLT